jgi:hypothetical protein
MSRHERKAAGERAGAWSDEELRTLKQLAKENTPTRVIALKLGRTEDAVRSKAHKEGVSLKPVNQSPYG